MSRSACEACGAALLWVKTARGRPMPLDAVEVAEAGPRAVLFRPDGARAERDAETGTTVGHASHFSTCPSAAQFRRAR
jgi:hypothetical protein